MEEACVLCCTRCVGPEAGTDARTGRPGCRPRGDRVEFKRTAVVDVGVCEGEVTEDWMVSHAPLSDECPSPHIPATDEGIEEFEAAAVGLVNEQGFEMPAMRVGHCRWKAGRTLSESLGNSAYLYRFGTWSVGDGEDESATFLAVNMHGGWVAVEDLPDWSWSFGIERGRTYLRVKDSCAQLWYDYFIGRSPKRYGHGC